MYHLLNHNSSMKLVRDVIKSIECNRVEKTAYRMNVIAKLKSFDSPSKQFCCLGITTSALKKMGYNLKEIHMLKLYSNSNFIDCFRIGASTRRVSSESGGQCRMILIRYDVIDFNSGSIQRKFRYAISGGFFFSQSLFSRMKCHLVWILIIEIK